MLAAERFLMFLGEVLGGVQVCMCLRRHNLWNTPSQHWFSQWTGVWSERMMPVLSEPVQPTHMILLAGARALLPDERSEGRSVSRMVRWRDLATSGL
jgi:hypothetical protein